VVVRRVAGFVGGTPGIPPGSHVLIACSGGPDSTALAAALGELRATCGLRLTLVHLRHGLRSEPDERDDEAVVRCLAAELGVDLRVEALAIAPGPNLEARARTARRRTLGTTAAAVCATHIALGHTLDDQAETVLLRLLRGGGRRGLAGMRAHDGMIVRPLLAARRADVRWYLAARRLRASLDRSNADLRVRRLLVPVLAAEFNPRVAEALAALAARFRDEDDLLDALADDELRRLRRDDGLRCEIAQLPPALARRVVRGWLATHGLAAPSAVHVERVRRAAARTTGTITLPGPRRVLREGNVLVCRPGPHAGEAGEFHLPLAPGETVRGSTWGLEVSAPRRWEAGEDPQRGPDGTLLDAEALPGPLAVRTRRRGERVRVPNVGTRKLHDVLVDRKVPRERRATLPVVVAGDAVLWVPGVVRSAVARVVDNTRWVLEVRLLSDDKLALPLVKPCGSLNRHVKCSEKGPR
jgi:tRNA(Ile)-lysidine synthase